MCEPERGRIFLRRIARFSKTALAAEVEEFREAHLRAFDDGGDPKDLAINFDVAGRWLLNETPLLALSLAMTAVDCESKSQGLWELLAAALAGCGKRREAEAVLWHARARFGDNVYVRLQLAKHLGRVGRVGEAEALYRETLRLFPGHAAANNALAHLLAEHHCEVEAEVYFRAAVAAHADAVYRTDLASLLVGLGRWEEAESLFLETMERFPKHAGCRLTYGVELVWRGEAEIAKAILAELKMWQQFEADALSDHVRLKTEGGARPLVEPAAFPPNLPLPGDNLPKDETWEALRAAFLLSPAVSEDLLLCTAEERVELRHEAQETLRRLLASHRNHPLVRLIAAGCGLDEPASLIAGTQLSIPLKLQMARRWGQGLAELEAEARTLAPLVWLAHLEAGIDHDGQALLATVLWLAAKPPASIAYLHQRLRRLSGMDGAIKRITLPSDTFKSIFGKTLAQMEDLAPDLLDIALMRMVEEELHAGMDVAIAA